MPDMLFRGIANGVFGPSRKYALVISNTLKLLTPNFTADKIVQISNDLEWLMTTWLALASTTIAGFDWFFC